MKEKKYGWALKHPPAQVLQQGNQFREGSDYGSNANKNACDTDFDPYCYLDRNHEEQPLIVRPGRPGR